MKLPTAFRRIQRVVVDAARGVVARRQSIRGLPGHTLAPGPLLSIEQTRPLDFVSRHPLMQPDRTSCGSSTLTLLRMPTYAAAVLDANDPDAVFGAAAVGVRRPRRLRRDVGRRLAAPVAGDPDLLTRRA